jgi:hypothetical protein
MCVGCTIACREVIAAAPRMASFSIYPATGIDIYSDRVNKLPDQ